MLHEFTASFLMPVPDHLQFPAPS